MIQNIKEDVIPDIIDNLQIQKMYKDDYVMKPTLYSLACVFK